MALSAGWGGIYLSYYVDVSSGATVVLFSATLFMLVLTFTGIPGKTGLRQGQSRCQVIPHGHRVRLVSLSRAKLCTCEQLRMMPECTGSSVHSGEDLKQD